MHRVVVAAGDQGLEVVAALAVAMRVIIPGRVVVVVLGPWDVVGGRGQDGVRSGVVQRWRPTQRGAGYSTVQSEESA